MQWRAIRYPFRYRIPAKIDWMGNFQITKMIQQCHEHVGHTTLKNY
jgi:hypothetical protein